MDINAIIVDNFLDNPDAVRKSALELSFRTTGTYPGFRSDRADEAYEVYIKEKLESILHCKIEEFKQDSFRFQMCMEGVDTWVHKDETEWAGVLYLTPLAPLESGTGIYHHNGFEWKLNSAIGNVYNRLALYRGTLHHRSIMPGFGDTHETGRLTQTFFFNTEHWRG
jgi:hypothetical protein